MIWKGKENLLPSQEGFLGKFSVGGAKSSGKLGIQGSFGIGIGAQIAYGVSATVMSETITWEALGAAARRITVEPDIMVGGINVKALLSAFGLKQNSSVEEISGAILGQYKPLIADAIDQSVNQRVASNLIMNQQVEANGKTIQEIDNDKSASTLQRTKSLLLKGINSLLLAKVKQNDEEIKNLENKKEGLNLDTENK